jgi:hypothetical protein
VKRLVIIAILLATGGCTTIEQPYAGFSSEEVWTAMKAVARTPTYDDWKIVANDAWIDEAAHRIEVYRRLQRAAVQPGAPPHEEQQTWKLGVSLVQANPPTVKVISRGFALPTTAQQEVDHYFQGVYDILIGLPSEAAAPPATPPAPMGIESR